MNQSSMRVLFLAAEAEPLIKVGGLGDVAGSLPVALRNIPDSNIDIRLAIPFHGMISRQGRVIERIATTNVAHGNGSIPAENFSTTINKLPVYLIAGGTFSPDAPVYSANIDVDAYKYTFFSLAALNIGRELNWQPHLIHANDWHTSPAIYALARMRSSDPFYRFTSGLLGVHNLPYGGVGSGPALGSFGLPPADNSPLPEWAQHMALPLGLLSADHIVAVSPTYAKEILTPEFGSGLDDFLRSRASSITGILNGLDPTSWNPETDPALTTNYSVRNLSLRLDNKIALQKEIGPLR